MAGTYYVSFSVLGDSSSGGAAGGGGGGGASSSSSAGGVTVRTVVVQSAACGLGAAMTASSQDSLIASMAGECGELAARLLTRGGKGEEE